MVAIILTVFVTVATMIDLPDTPQVKPATECKSMEATIQEPTLMRVTYYTATGNHTASGVYPEYGMCAMNRENLGRYAVVYTQEMELIDVFEITDIGGHHMLRNGTAIDIFVEDIQQGRNFTSEYGDYLLVEIVDYKEGANESN